MMDPGNLIFPELICLQDYQGVFETYFKDTYSIFENDFIRSHPLFLGTKVAAQKHPQVDGIHRTFYHITHVGENEANRMPDLRRMERIRFPKFCITNSPHRDLLVWKNRRGKDTRILIFNEEEGYLVVLAERKNYNLLWTAYSIQQQHRKQKLINEYEAYKKAKTA